MHFIFLLMALLPLTNGYHSNPGIYLFSYMKTDSFQRTAPEPKFNKLHKFQNDFISKNVKYWVISAETQQVLFSCKHSSPIFWTFPHLNQLEKGIDYKIGSQQRRVSVFQDDTRRPFNIIFEEIVRITTTNLEFFSANLTCTTDSFGFQGQYSIHVFLRGKSPIEHQGETLNVSLEYNKKIRRKTAIPLSNRLVLPCRPSSPKVDVLLEQQIMSTNKISGDTEQNWIISELSSLMEFDPRVGFVFQRDKFPAKYLGLYRCSIADTEEAEADEIGAFVYVNILLNSDPQNDRVEDDIGIKSVLSGKATIEIKPFKLISDDFYEIWGVTCCTGIAKNPPKLYTQKCGTPLRCQLVKSQLLNHVSWKDERLPRILSLLGKSHFENVTSDCTKTVLYGVSELVLCRGDNIHFFNQYVNMFHPALSGSLGNRSERVTWITSGKAQNEKQIDDEKLTQLSGYVPLDKAKSISNKIWLTLGSSSSRHLFDTDIERHMVPVVFSNRSLFVIDSNVDQQINDFELELEVMAEHDKDVLYKGETFLIMCFAPRYFYGKGQYLQVNWKNGTFINVKLRKWASRNKIVYFRKNADINYGMGRVFESAFGEDMVASTEMESVSCWMPINNSSDWGHVSQKLTVLPSVAPKFAEELNETVFFYLGDVSQKLDCKITEAVPVATVTVFRNGKRVNVKPEDHIEMEKESEKEQTDFKIIQETDNITNFVHVILKFGPINHEMHGVYECLAKNINGTVTRRVYVYVIEKWWTITRIFVFVAILTVGTAFIIIGISLRYKGLA